MYTAAAMSADRALIPAVDLSAELVTGWPAPLDQQAGSGTEPVIYRVGRPPYTQAAGVGAARHATALILQLADRAGATEQALISMAFRIGLSTGAYAARHALGHPLPTLPPPKERPAQWMVRFEFDLADWILTRLAVDPPPQLGNAIDRYHKWAVRVQQKCRKMRPTASYVRQGRSRKLGPYVQASAAMLMATNAAKGRRMRRIALGIRLYREDAGLTQQELANRSDMPRERVVEYENQVHEPGPDKLEAFAQALGVEAWEFEARGTRAEREQQ